MLNYQLLNFDSIIHLANRSKLPNIQSKVVGFDESGTSVNDNNFWIHSSSTDDNCYYACYDKPGKQGIYEIGILPQFTGIAIDDYWKFYFKFGWDQALYNSHNLWEL